MLYSSVILNVLYSFVAHFQTALLTRYYTHHALRPSINSETTHLRHFIKTHSSTRVSISSIYLVYLETVQLNRLIIIICYNYSKPKRSTIFISNKLVANLDIETKTPDS